MDKYKIYCETDGWIEVIASSEPTQCPINNGHEVRENSLTLLEQDVKENIDSYLDLNLEDYKKLRYKEIDARTVELIDQGYVYKTKIFSLSSNAQTNILALDSTRDEPSLTYPIIYNTIDDNESYSIIDSTDLHNMYMTALGTKKIHLDSGTNLKNSIRDAVSEEAVDSIIDNR